MDRRAADGADQPRAPDARALTRARISLDDILAAARSQHGLERLDQVKFAVLEVGGTISIVPTGTSA